LDHAPTQAPKASAINRAIYITANVESGEKLEIIPANSILPARAELPVTLPGAEASVYILMSGENAATDAAVPLGEVVVKLGEGENHEQVNLTLVVTVSSEEGLKAEIVNNAGKTVVSSLAVPF
jgi:hypothetical protein